MVSSFHNETPKHPFRRCAEAPAPLRSRLQERLSETGPAGISDPQEGRPHRAADGAPPRRQQRRNRRRARRVRRHLQPRAGAALDRPAARRPARRLRDDGRWVDPTGAGDTFCGATLAHILHNMPIQEAAEVACDLAAQNVSHIGPSFIVEHLRESKAR